MRTTGSGMETASGGVMECSPQHLEGLWQVIGAVLRTIPAQGEIV